MPEACAIDLLRADDRFGYHRGRVVQGHDVAWASIAGLVECASYGRLAHQHLAHGGGGSDPACAVCQAGDASWNTGLLPVFDGELGAVSDLHARSRRQLRVDLAAAGRPLPDPYRGPG